MRSSLIAAFVFLAPVAGSLALGSCASDTTAAVHDIVTSIALDPSEFLGNVACSNAPGAPQSYIVLFRDLSDPDGVYVNCTGLVPHCTQTSTGTTCACAAPTPAQTCTLPVAFTQDIIEGHQYGATVQVFDVAADEVDPTNPTWTTECAIDGVGAAVVVVQQVAYVTGCAPIHTSGSSTTSIVIDLASLVQGLGCASADGKIDGLRVTPVSPVGTTLPDLVATCGQASVTYDTGLTAPGNYSFLVTATGPNQTTPGWATTCSATTSAGVAVGAACDPLTNLGALSIDAPTLMQTLDVTCGGSGVGAAKTYDVSFDTGMPTAVSATGVPCAVDATVGPVAAGSHGGDVTVRDATGARIAHAICFATATPGQTVLAPCVQD